MASDRVFNTVELQEEILGLLPLPDLLAAQAVCSRWKDTIENSSVLQEQLFFRPAKNNITWLVDVTNLPGGIGPLYRRYETRLRVKAAVPTNSPELKSHFGLIATPVRINPLCMRWQTQIKLDLDTAANNGTPFMLKTTLRAASKDGDKDSWRRMFLTQPPVQYVTLEVGLANGLSTGGGLMWTFPPEETTDLSTKVRKVFVEGGVRVGDVVDAFRTLCDVSREGRESCVIRMHGAIAATGSDEDVVQARTKLWRDALGNVEALQNLNLVDG